jgi:phage tail P2-like protein
MNLDNLNLLELQTSNMQKDLTTIAMCNALEPQFKQLTDEVKLCLIYSRIDELEGAILDELAWQMSIDWYDINADIDTKRSIVKSATRVHRYRGTPYAVEEVIQTYFGDGYVQEWFEYGGEPYMFKVITNNPSVTSELAQQFLKVLNSVKNVRSHLEEIVISLSGEMDMYFGGIVQTGDFLEIRQVM